MAHETIEGPSPVNHGAVLHLLEVASDLERQGRSLYCNAQALANVLEAHACGLGVSPPDDGEHGDD